MHMKLPAISCQLGALCSQQRSQGGKGSSRTPPDCLPYITQHSRLSPLHHIASLHWHTLLPCRYSDYLALYLSHTVKCCCKYKNENISHWRLSWTLPPVCVLYLYQNHRKQKKPLKFSVQVPVACVPNSYINHKQSLASLLNVSAQSADTVDKNHNHHDKTPISLSTDSSPPPTHPTCMHILRRFCHKV